MKKNKKPTERDTIDVLVETLERANVDYVQCFDNMLDKKTCKEYIKKFNEINEKGLCAEGRTVLEYNKDKKTSYDYALHPGDADSELVEIHNHVYNIVGTCVYSYLLNIGQMGLIFTGLTLDTLKDNVPAEHIPDIPKSIGLESMWFRKYPKNIGGYHMPHSDNDSSKGDARMLAVVVYLNDIKYGGETVFPILNRNVKPKAGRIAIFPSYFTHIHYGARTRSDRYVFVCHIDKINETKEEEENG